MLEAGLSQRDGVRIGAALTDADPAGAARSALDWPAHGEALTLWAGRLWEADDPYPILASFWDADPLPGAGLWLPAAVLHLRDPQRFAPWGEAARLGYATLDDALDAAGSAAERYRLFNEGATWLCAHHPMHPLETADVLAVLAPEAERIDEPAATFGGFCADTFRFLAELADGNRREWMDGQRDRYRFAVREPLAELCRALAARYVGPVLRGVHGWDIDVEPRSGRALTSICKNDYGRSRPYNTSMWITFCRRGGRRDAQLYVRLDATGLRFGFRVGRKARDAVRRFRTNVEKYGDLLYRALREGGALASCRFDRPDGADAPVEVAGPESLREWAAGRSFEIACALPADAPLLGGDELAGEILLTFDRLLPAFACAVADDPLPFLAGRVGAASGGRYTEADFRRETFLSDDWLRRARGLLDLKRQLILQGVPGTGKTHVARGLARLLTGGRDEAVRLVQFHPAYTYEEFVEGVKVRSVEVGGRHDVTYPVEDGLLCTFAAEAARRPSEPHVLIIDEINRGNLPRIFGELLYLLEYRDQAVCPAVLAARLPSAGQPLPPRRHERRRPLHRPHRSGAAPAVLVHRHAAGRLGPGGVAARPRPGRRTRFRGSCNDSFRAAQRQAALRPRAAGAGRPQLFHGARPGRATAAADLAAPRAAAAGRVFRRPTGPVGGLRPRRVARRRSAPIRRQEASAGGGSVGPPEFRSKRRTGRPGRRTRRR